MKNFAGILKLNDLDEISIFNFPISFISVLDNHWFAVFVSRESIEIFDSLGPESKLFQNNHLNEFLCNNLINRNLKIFRQVQDVGSVYCGQFVLLFLKLRAHMTFDEISTVFSNDFTENDKLVIKFLQ